MEAMEELIKLGECMVQATALLSDEDADEASNRRASTFLNVVAFGNVVSLIFNDPDELAIRGSFILLSLFPLAF